MGNLKLLLPKQAKYKDLLMAFSGPSAKFCHGGRGGSYSEKNFILWRASNSHTEAFQYKD